MIEYICFSRFNKAEDLLIQPYQGDRFDFSNTAKTLEDITAETKRLLNKSMDFLRNLYQTEVDQEYCDMARDVYKELKDFYQDQYRR